MSHRVLSLRRLVGFTLGCLLLGASARGQAQCALNTADPSVTICTPSDGATVNSPLHLVAGTTSSSPVTAIKVYVDYVAVYTVNANQVDTNLTLTVGKHRINVQAWNKSGAVFKQVIFVTVPSVMARNVPGIAAVPS